MSRSSGFGSVVLVAMLSGCAAQPPALVVDSSAKTFDGLYPVENVSVTGAWARPDIDLTGYERILLEGAGIQFRPVPAAERLGGSASGRGTFPLNEQQKERLAKAFSDAFRSELSRSEHFVLTDETGPDVLKLRAGLLDVVSRVPPVPLGRSDVYLESLGEATLTIELVDSESGTVLVRAIDRQTLRRPGGLQRSSAVTNWQEVKRLADTWARRLRVGLDALDERMTLE